MKFWFVLSTICGVVVTILTLYISHGEYFSKIFFQDTLDTGMDFFHSIEYTQGRSPYKLFNTLYPPLANLFFYLLYLLVPRWQSEQWAGSYEGGIYSRGTSIDLRVWQSTLLIFILFIMMTSVLLVLIVKRIFNDSKISSLVGICVLLSYGVLIAYERGNVVIIAMLCSMFFVFFKDSKNKFVSEVALVALAVAAGFKIYPALLGFLLLYDKQYKKAVKTVIYGLIMFILPVFVFKEGLNGLNIFMNKMGGFSSGGTGGGVYVPPISGLAFNNIVNEIAVIISKILKCGINEKIFGIIVPKFNIIVALLILVCGFFMKKNWQRVLTCCLAILLYQTQVLYVLVFMSIPFLCMMKEEKCLSNRNIIPYIALLNMQILFPIVDIPNMMASMVYGRFQLSVVVLMIYIIVKAISNIISYKKI